MNNEKNVYFIVGHHGIGKTFLIEQLSERFNLTHIDTGPLIRRVHKDQTNGRNIDIGEWVKLGESKYGKDFTNMIICKSIESTINNSENSLIFITGNRSLAGINYISRYFSFSSKPKIIYIDAPFRLLKENYVKREKKSLTNEEFKKILDKEVDSGLNDIRNYVLSNLDTCIYYYKEENDIYLYDTLKDQISSDSYVLKRGKSKNDEDIVSY